MDSPSKFSSSDPDLLAVAEKWSSLPPAVRADILAMFAAYYSFFWQTRRPGKSGKKRPRNDDGQARRARLEFRRAVRCSPGVGCLGRTRRNVVNGVSVVGSIHVRVIGVHSPKERAHEIAHGAARKAQRPHHQQKDCEPTHATIPAGKKKPGNDPPNLSTGRQGRLCTAPKILGRRTPRATVDPVAHAD